MNVPKSRRTCLMFWVKYFSCLRLMQDFQNKYFKRGFNMNGTDQVGSIDDDKINGSGTNELQTKMCLGNWRKSQMSIVTRERALTQNNNNNHIFSGIFINLNIVPRKKKKNFDNRNTYQESWTRLLYNEVPQSKGPVSVVLQQLQGISVTCYEKILKNKIQGFRK